MGSTIVNVLLCNAIVFSVLHTDSNVQKACVADDIRYYTIFPVRSCLSITILLHDFHKNIILLEEIAKDFLKKHNLNKEPQVKGTPKRKEEISHSYSDIRTYRFWTYSIIHVKRIPETCQFYMAHFAADYYLYFHKIKNKNQ